MDIEWEHRRSGWVGGDARTPFDVDYSRVVHSSSFRRLQGKTQTLNLGDSDFYRTRLTHSLEVANIASGIVRQYARDFSDDPAVEYLPPLSLMQTIGLAHDLGHPPFGHGGEIALNYCMRDNGGFEGNGHTLRILSRLESFSKEHGADLTRRALLGILKYPVRYSLVANKDEKACLNMDSTSIKMIDRKKSKPPKCYLDSEAEVVDWMLSKVNNRDRVLLEAIESEPEQHSRSKHKSFDASILDAADDIAYGVHDLEDAIALELITEEQFRVGVPASRCQSFMPFLKERHSGDPYEILVNGLFGEERKRYISRLVGHFIWNTKVEQVEGFSDPIFRYRATLPCDNRDFLSAIQGIIVDNVIKSPNVQHLEFKGQRMVVSVFEALQSEPESFLPKDAFLAYDKANGDSRIICDHVAGMTDIFLLKTFERLFSPRMGSVFDRL